MKTSIVVTVIASWAVAATGEFISVAMDGGAGGYEAFPDVCRLKDGRLLCVFYAGYDHVSLPNNEHPKGGAVAACYSSDEGKTWTEPTIIHDGPHDDRDPSVVQLSNGRIICHFFCLDHPEPMSARRYLPRGIWMVSSDDGGKTWSEARTLPGEFCSSPIRVLSNGRLLLGTYDEIKGWSACFVSASDDNGETWSELVKIPYTQPQEGFIDYTEPDFIELKDGSILAVQRSDRTEMATSISMDQGKTWSVSQPIGFKGHCPYLHRAANGTILLGHRVPNTSLHWSADDGKTWSDNVVVDETIGAYPSMVNLSDGSVLVVYYEEGAGSNIRAKRLTVDPDGIRFVE